MTEGEGRDGWRLGMGGRVSGGVLCAVISYSVTSHHSSGISRIPSVISHYSSANNAYCGVLCGVCTLDVCDRRSYLVVGISC